MPAYILILCDEISFSHYVMKSHFHLVDCNFVYSAHFTSYFSWLRVEYRGSTWGRVETENGTNWFIKWMIWMTSLRA